MATVKVQIRPGAYYDSVVLMQLQRALAALPGVEEVGVVMGTAANKELLGQSGLLTAEVERAGGDDLVIAVQGAQMADVEAALAQVDALLAARQQSGGSAGYRPKSLEAAAQMLPGAQWVLVSVPGRYAAGVARSALALGKHVFLYSDNMSLDDEIELKRNAAAQGLLVMGPDCGTAIVGGMGLGFANRVRRGTIGLVGASGTGLQLVTARIHQLGGGITHALGTGGRDLSTAVGGVAARQALDLLARDPETRVVVLISKPPAADVAEEILCAARGTGKPVVISFIGYRPAESEVENVRFVHSLDGAAILAVNLAAAKGPGPGPERGPQHFAPGQRYLRALYSGGTLAVEAQVLLRDYLPAVYSNVAAEPGFRLARATASQGHTIVDLGDDEFTVGRLHPMLDNDLRTKRLLLEAADPETAVVLLDVVLGYGAHPDPAGELAPAICAARELAAGAGRHLEVVAVVVGTDEDPQNLAVQVEQLQAAGARVELNHERAVREVGAQLRALQGGEALPPVPLQAVTEPMIALNVGLESFAASLVSQGAQVVHVEWRPPAGGNEKMMGILARLKAQR